MYMGSSASRTSTQNVQSKIVRATFNGIRLRDGNNVRMIHITTKQRREKGKKSAREREREIDLFVLVNRATD